jgi:hypothetical protein
MSEIPEKTYEVPPEDFDKLVKILKNSDKVIVRNLKVTWEEHELVHSTSDGEYPEHKQRVLAEFHGKNVPDNELHHVSWDDDNAQWVHYFDFLEEIPHVPEEMTVYWKPLTNLKAQYEIQQDRK